MPLRDLALAAILVPALAGGLPAQIPWSDDRWQIEAAESAVEEYRGRQALRLRNGAAWLSGVTLRDGTIEFDLAAPAGQGFHGIAVRAVDRGNFEHFYLRPHQSRNPDATQYTPVFNGVTGWQIYATPRFALPLEIADDRWMHVRISFRGARLEVDVDGQTLVFPEMVRVPEAGEIGLTSGGAPARFANLIVREGAPLTLSDSAGAPVDSVPSGIIEQWRVSSPFTESRLDPLTTHNPADWTDLTWTPLSAGVRGIANLARLHGLSADTNTVFAAVTLRAERAQSVRVRFGFSDRVHVLLNGRTIYRGSALWRSRDYRFLGTIGLHDEVILPLRAGDNELWFAVSESFGGWGVTAQLPDGGARAIQPPAR